MRSLFIKTSTVIFLSFLFLLSEYSFSKTKSDKIIVGNKARFTVISPVCIRLEYSEAGKFIDNQSLFAENRNTNFMEFKTRNDNGNTIIETTGFKLVYKPDGKPFSPDNLEVIINKGNEKVKWIPGAENKNNLGGTLQTLDQIKGKVPLNDGILARDGWYLLDDSKRPILTNNWAASRPEGSGIDWYLFAYGNDYKSALKSLTKIGGEIPLPRKYTLGSWYSRYWPYSSKDYHQLVEEYKQYDFPIDVMVMDMDWHRDGWTGWSWNRELLPDAEDLLKYFHNNKINVTLNLHPAEGVKPHEDAYEKFMKDMGVNITGIPKDKLPTIPYDASNKKYVDNLFKDIHLPLEKEGVDFWWLDWQQSEYTRGNKDLKNLEWLNRCYFNFSKKDGKRGISFSRWGGWGDHKYPIHFSGDASTNWEMLEFEVPFTSTAGNVGCFFWSHDIGGHMGGINPETNARWVQFGATTAALRLHSTRDKTMDKRPWLFEDKYLQAMKIVFHLRSELFPYIYSNAWKSCKESIPLNSPMYIEYPENEEAYNSPQQYFFGDAFLVAPITQAGSGKNNLANQKVWFPKGMWYNWFTGEKIVGDEKTRSVWADIYEFPLYAKGGVPITLQPYTQRMTSEPLKQLVIKIYPGEDSKKYETTLYEDDGLSCDYTKGKYALTKIEYFRNGDVYKIKISPAKGKYKGQLQKRSYIIELPGLEKATKINVNDKTVPLEYISETFSNKITIPETSINKEINITLEAKEIDGQLIKDKIRKKIEAELSEGIDSRKSPVEIIKQFSDKDKKAEERECVISLLSGVTIYVEDQNKITLMKAPDSKASDVLSLSVVDEIGKNQNEILKQRFNLNNGESKTFVLQPLQADYISVIRKLNLQITLDGEEFEITRTMDKKDPYIYSWNIIGAFDFSTGQISENIYEPEKEIDLSASYKGKDGKIITWKEINSKNQIIDFNSIIPNDNSIAYAVTNIKSESDQEITLNISSDDGVEVWINKEKIHSNNVSRGIETAVDKIKANLKKGNNILLVKISQGGGGWGFKVNYECQNPVEISSR